MCTLLAKVINGQRNAPVVRGLPAVLEGVPGGPQLNGPLEIFNSRERKMTRTGPFGFILRSQDYGALM